LLLGTVAWDREDRLSTQYPADLRGLRTRADGQVPDGPAASPGQVPELRTMPELTGKA